MAKIRCLNLFDIFGLKKLVSHLSDEKFFDYTKAFLFYPLIVINNFMPLSLKFLPDFYTAFHDNTLKGLISIKSRRRNYHKWRINKLLLDENAIETGEQLINYVVAKYGAKGVETIEVDIESTQTDMIDLFSKACGFRYCLDYQYFELKTCYYKNRIINSQTHIFRPFKPSDTKDIADLYNKNLSPYYKFPLSKIPEEFDESVFSGLNKKSLFKFIMEDKFSKQIRGYVQIETENNKAFVIEVVLLQSYENYFEDMLTFAISQIYKRANTFTLYFRSNKFHQNSADFEKILGEIDNEPGQSYQIFVKDFYRQIREDEKIPTAAILYNEIKGKPVYKI